MRPITILLAVLLAIMFCASVDCKQKGCVIYLYTYVNKLNELRQKYLKTEDENSKKEILSIMRFLRSYFINYYQDKCYSAVDIMRKQEFKGIDSKYLQV